jgi:hypothetical protein
VTCGDSSTTRSKLLRKHLDLQPPERLLAGVMPDDMTAGSKRHARRNTMNSGGMYRRDPVRPRARCVREVQF